VAEIAAIAANDQLNEYFSPRDQVDIVLGTDFNFENVESKEIVSLEFDFERLTVKNDGPIKEYIPLNEPGSNGVTNSYNKNRVCQVPNLTLFGKNDYSFTLVIDFNFTPTITIDEETKSIS
jgi:hypothetical protein